MGAPLVPAPYCSTPGSPCSQPLFTSRALATWRRRGYAKVSPAPFSPGSWPSPGLAVDLGNWLFGNMTFLGSKATEKRIRKSWLTLRSKLRHEH